MFPLHRIALEPRSGIWLLFYETLIKFSPQRYSLKNCYEQQFLRIFHNFDVAKKAADFEKVVRYIDTDIIIRDDSQRNVRLRNA